MRGNLGLSRNTGPLHLLRCSEVLLSAPTASPLTEADFRRRLRNLGSGQRRRRSRGSPTARELASDRCSRSPASVSPISFVTRFGSGGRGLIQFLPSPFSLCNLTGNAALTDIFECEDGKTCCSPKTAIKEREIDLIRIRQHQQQQNSNRRPPKKRPGSGARYPPSIDRNTRLPSSSVPDRYRPQQQTAPQGYGDIRAGLQEDAGMGCRV